MPTRFNGVNYTPPDYTNAWDYLGMIILWGTALLCLFIISYTFFRPHRILRVNYYLRAINCLTIVAVTLNLYDYMAEGIPACVYVWTFLMYFLATMIALGQLSILKIFIALLPPVVTIQRITGVQIALVIFYLLCNILFFMKGPTIGQPNSLDTLAFYPLTLLLIVIMLYEEAHNIFISFVLFSQLSQLKDAKNKLQGMEISGMASTKGTESVSGSNFDYNKLNLNSQNSPKGEKIAYEVAGYKKLLVLIIFCICWDAVAIILTAIIIYENTRYSFNCFAVTMALGHVLFVSLIFYTTQSLKLEKNLNQPVASANPSPVTSLLRRVISLKR